MTPSSTPAADGAHGYEAAAERFMAYRTASTVGVATVRRWAGLLPPGAAVLDLGCGHGAPLGQALVDDGVRIAGIDASATLLAAFRARFPDAPAEHGTVEASSCFGRRFEGVLAWGLLFLLPADAQAQVLRKAASALVPGGRLCFTAPRPACAWTDRLTGQPSRSLGADTYRRLVEAAGLVLDGEADDEGQNHYYFAHRPAPTPAP